MLIAPFVSPDRTRYLVLAVVTIRRVRRPLLKTRLTAEIDVRLLDDYERQWDLQDPQHAMQSCRDPTMISRFIWPKNDLRMAHRLEAW